jgi:hypothetical protein
MNTCLIKECVLNTDDESDCGKEEVSMRAREWAFSGNSYDVSDGTLAYEYSSTQAVLIPSLVIEILLHLTLLFLNLLVYLIHPDDTNCS